MPKGREANRLLDNQKRQNLALELRVRGATAEQIAEQVGFPSEQAAERAVKAALDRQPAQDAQTFRRLQLELLQRGIRALSGIATNKYFAIDRGQVVEYAPPGQTPQPLLDPSHNLRAWEVLLKYSERLAKLEGWDAPTQHQVAVLTPEVVEQARSQLEREQAELERERAALMAATIDVEPAEDE